jgi:hypothetical protein
MAVLATPWFLLLKIARKQSTMTLRMSRPIRGA